MIHRILATSARRWLVAAFLVLLAFLLPEIAFAQDGGLVDSLISSGPPWLVALPPLVVAIVGLVMAAVPDDKMPPTVAKILNAIALNFGAARNDPDRNGPDAGAFGDRS